jgi:hypothetical protein|nr:MAG TPA: hypothetical protein [Caudoviricetes sp.]
MKIKVTTSCSGLTFSFTEGQIVDVNKKIGEDLVKVGFAEEIRTSKNISDTRRRVPKSEVEDKVGDGDNADT